MLDEITVKMFSGAVQPLNDTQACFGLKFANSGTGVLLDFGESIAKSALASRVKAIVSVEALDFLNSLNENNYLVVSKPDKDNVNGLFSIIEAGYKIPAAIVATPDTIDFIYRTCQKKGLNFNKAFLGGFLPIKKEMEMHKFLTPQEVPYMLYEWKESNRLAEYDALQSGITLRLGNIDSMEFFTCSHIKGEVGVKFVSAKTPAKTQLVYIPDGNLEQIPEYGIPIRTSALMRYTGTAYTDKYVKADDVSFAVSRGFELTFRGDNVVKKSSFVPHCLCLLDLREDEIYRVKVPGNDLYMRNSKLVNSLKLMAPDTGKTR